MTARTAARPRLRSALLALAALAGCGEPAPSLEGTPRVLQLHATSAVLGWRVDRAQACELALTAPGRAVSVASSSAPAASGAGFEHRVALQELAPGVEHGYALRCGGPPLFEGAFRTAPAAGSAFTFAVIGDTGKASPEQARVAERMAAVAPDFVLHTGDVLYVDDDDAAFLGPYRALLPRVPFWVAFGNHDIERAELWAGLFDRPQNGPRNRASEKSFFFDFGDARVAVADSNGGSETFGRRLPSWLREVFTARPEARWRFVVLHHPPYTWGHHPPHALGQQHLVPLFEELGVDVVFSGHDHNYQRTAPLRGGRPAREGERGVVYVVSGAGGARLYDVAPRETWPDALRAANGERHSFTHVVASSERLEVEQIDLDGTAIDRFTVEARHAEVPRAPMAPDASSVPAPAR